MIVDNLALLNIQFILNRIYILQNALRNTANMVILQVKVKSQCLHVLQALLATFDKTFQDKEHRKISKPLEIKQYTSKKSLASLVVQGLRIRLAV